jgi:hypothetical protein
VQILHRDWTTAYETYTDSNGFYRLDNVEKGRYMALYAIRPKEYPRANAVSKDNMRLEFWAWNVLADKDLTINPRYHKLELYGTNVFEIFGGYKGLFVYFRPMSLTRMLSYSKENYMDKQKMEAQGMDISVKPEYLEVKIFADEKPLKINSITPIPEYVGGMTMTGYVVQVDVPQSEPPYGSYVIFRVEAINRQHNEQGENLYFYEVKEFK